MKTLIVYFSYTNHTRIIAEKIKKSLNCDILEIKPKIPYSIDYDKVVNDTEENARTKLAPDINPISVNLKDYDVIILGTPVWWYTIAPPIRTFLKTYNLKDKIVIPFATNAGWLGSTFKEIESICTGQVENEISIQFSTNYEENRLLTSNHDLENWLDKIKSLSK